MLILTRAPKKLALTAASPIWRGYLSDVDCRWNVISVCSDDRTAEERGLAVSLISFLHVKFVSDPAIF